MFHSMKYNFFWIIEPLSLSAFWCWCFKGFMDNNMLVWYTQLLHFFIRWKSKWISWEEINLNYTTKLWAGLFLVCWLWLWLFTLTTPARLITQISHSIAYIPCGLCVHCGACQFPKVQVQARFPSTKKKSQRLWCGFPQKHMYYITT